MKLKQLKVPANLYHVAKKRDVEAIKKMGLKTTKDYILHGLKNDEPGVNMLSDLDDFYRPFQPDDVVFTVKTAGLDKKKFELLGDTWWRYGDTISPANLDTMIQFHK